MDRMVVSSIIHLHRIHVFDSSCHLASRDSHTILHQHLNDFETSTVIGDSTLTSKVLGSKMWRIESASSMIGPHLVGINCISTITNTSLTTSIASPPLLTSHAKMHLVPLTLAFLALAPRISTGSREASYIGCFSSPVPLSDIGGSIYQSRGLCQQRCSHMSQWVFGLGNSTHCYCGGRIPDASREVGEASCNTPCPGYPPDTCKSCLAPVILYSLISEVDVDGMVCK
jgi:hypothetical protein